MDVKEEGILGADIATHWYYVSKGLALRSFLGKVSADEVLDVGAGSGIFSRQLIDAGLCQRATCVDPAYKREYTELYNGRPLSFVQSVEQPSQPLILMMDVLEHVDSDAGLLRYYAGSLPHNGHVLITVPAFQFLWSGHDVFLEHRRRYTRASLEQVVDDAGLRVVRSRYFFGLLFPVAAAMRLNDRRRYKDNAMGAKSALRRCSPFLNSALTFVHAVERRAVFPFNHFGGLTVFCLAQRR